METVGLGFVAAACLAVVFYTVGWVADRLGLVSGYDGPEFFFVGFMVVGLAGLGTVGLYALGMVVRLLFGVPS